LIGDRFLDLAWRSFGAVFAYGTILVLVSILAIALRLVEGTSRWLALVCIGEALAFFVVPLVVRGTAVIWPPDDYVSLGASRYFVLPILFLLSAMAIGLDAHLGARATNAVFDWWAILTAWFMALLFLNYSLPNGRTLGPDWTTSLRQAQETCPTDTDGYVNVPIAPGAPWSARLPCP
jgi:hypothetical protein